MKVFLWSLAFRSLNTDDKLQRKFRRWALSPSGCRLCLKKEENLDHLFLPCEFAHQSWGWMARRVAVHFCLPQRIDDLLMEGLNAWNLGGKAKVIGNCAFRANLWHIWLERNARSFEDKSLKLDSFCNYVQNTSSWWIFLHKKFFCNYNLLMIVKDWKALGV